MIREYKGNSKKGGVYKITNINNGKIYIGSSKCFKNRINTHQNQLENNRHHNKHLQASWNKHGKDAFLFEVVEVVDGDKESRFKVEQKYIDQMIFEEKWEQTFNFRKKSDQKERSCWSLTPEETSKKLSKALSGLKRTKETREKISKSRKGMQFSEEHKKALSKSKIGSKISEEARAKMSNSHKSKKCQEILKKTYNSNKEYIISRQKDAVSKKHQLITPEGELIEIKNLNQFCKERGMHSSGFSNLLKKKDPTKASYRGWKYLGSK